MKIVNKLIIALIVVLFCFIGIHFLTKTDGQKAVNVDINNELLEDSVGVSMTELDYASQKYVIFHDYYGLFVYDIENHLIYRALDLNIMIWIVQMVIKHVIYILIITIYIYLMIIKLCDIIFTKIQ